MYNWLEYKDQGGNSYYACGYCNNTVWERSNKCPFCGAPMNYQKVSGGKRFLSWVVLAVLDYLAMLVVSLVANLAIALGQTVYDNHRALFWIVIVFGGSFGLGLAWFLVWAVPAYIVSLSQKIAKSKKGLRYYIIGGAAAVLYTIDLIAGLAMGTFSDPKIISVVNHIVWVALNIIIIYAGKSEVEE